MTRCPTTRNLPKARCGPPRFTRNIPSSSTREGDLCPSSILNTGNWAWVYERGTDPLVTIHRDTAKQASSGDWVYIETEGKIKQKAKLTEDILPNVINAEASWWFPEKEGKLPSLFGAFESNANMLTIDDPETLDPLTGGWCNRALLCKIYKVEE